MSSVKYKLSFLGLATLTLLATTGCASFKLKNPPPGLIEVSSSQWRGSADLRMKAPDNVGLNITTFANHRGGTLPLWANDMVKKLAARGYTLESQTPVKSANGVAGTRFDFSYTPLGAKVDPVAEANEKFYTAILFVTDDWKVVVQLAGSESLKAAHAGDIERILKEIRIRGCKVGSKVCKAGQPAPAIGVVVAAAAEAPVDPPVEAGKTKPDGPGTDDEFAPAP